MGWTERDPWHQGHETRTMRTQDFCTFDRMSVRCPLNTPELSFCYIIIPPPLFPLVEIRSICCSKLTTISIYSSNSVISPSFESRPLQCKLLNGRKVFPLISFSATTPTPCLGTRPWRQACNEAPRCQRRRSDHQFLYNTYLFYSSMLIFHNLILTKSVFIL